MWYDRNIRGLPLVRIPISPVFKTAVWYLSKSTSQKKQKEYQKNSHGNFPYELFATVVSYGQNCILPMIKDTNTNRVEQLLQKNYLKKATRLILLTSENVTLE